MLQYSARLLYDEWYCAPIMCENNSTHNPIQTNQPTTEPNLNTLPRIIIVNIFKAGEELRRSLSREIGIFNQLLRSYPGLFI